MDMRRVETKLYMRPDGSGEITIKVWKTIGELSYTETLGFKNPQELQKIFEERGMAEYYKVEEVGGE